MERSDIDSDGHVIDIGDHLYSPRTGYTHHGLYVGDGKVIHYSGFASGPSSGQIALTTLDDFGSQSPVYVKKHWIRTFDGSESVQRAYSRLGEDWYNVILNNCEHFVTWCIFGFHSSSQVNESLANITTAALAHRAISSAGDVVFQGERTRQVAAAVSSYAASSVASSATTTSSAGVAVGAAAGIAAGTGVATATGVTTTAAVVGGVAAAPALLAVGATVAVGYGVKKLWDWFTD